MIGLAARIVALTGWRRAAAATALGAIAALALPPFFALPLLAVAFTALVWLLEAAPRRAAFWTGWWFGFGFHVIGLYWIANALLFDPARFGWLLPFAVFGLPAALAVFTGAATWAVAASGLAGWRRVVLLAVAWTLAEWLRGHLFTGFPWNLAGYGWTAVPAVMQFAALAGAYGLSLLTVLVAALPATLGRAASSRRERWLPVSAGFALLLAVGAGGALRLATTPVETHPGLVVRLVQANVDQAAKWRPELRAMLFQRYLALSERPTDGRTPLIVWPETAVPYLLEEDHARRAEVARLVASGGLVLTGATRVTDRDKAVPRLWNSVVAVAGGGEIVAAYDKFHLVPFGEYLPFRSILGRIGIDKVVYGPLDFSPGPGPHTLRLDGLPPVGPLVCYEAIFPGAVVDADDRPGWLLNVSNDGWYGFSTGPFQHFAMARMRSVEEGLPLVRAANTGISGVVDPLGRVTARIGLQQTGTVEAPLPRPLPPPPYARLGDAVPAGLVLAMLALALFRRRL